jgi:O-antigen ligase
MRSRNRLIEFLYATTLASLFSGIGYDTAFAKIRPFEFLACLSALAALPLLTRNMSRRSLLPLPVLAFFAIHVLSAFTVDTTNGAREFVQIAAVCLFVFPFLLTLEQIDVRAFFRCFAGEIVLIVVLNIVWHLWNGHPFGWKLLNDPKSAFLLLPVFLVAALGIGQRRYAALLTMLTLLVVVMSGERKAYLVALAALVISYGLLNWRTVTIVGLAVGAVGAFVIYDPNTYLAHQVASLIAPDLPVNVLELSPTSVVESLSNTERAFTFQVGTQQFLLHPVFGVGTNNFDHITAAIYGFLPAYLLVGIHNEFFRVLVENGLVGFLVYGYAWASAFARIKPAHFARGLFFGFVDAGDRIRLSLFSACLVYCLFESSKTLTFIALVAAARIDVLLPVRAKDAAVAVARAAIPGKRLGVGYRLRGEAHP